MRERTEYGWMVHAVTSVGTNLNLIQYAETWQCAKWLAENYWAGEGVKARVTKLVKLRVSAPRDTDPRQQRRSG